MGKGVTLDGVGITDGSVDLEAALQRFAGLDAERAAAAEVIRAIAAVAVELEALIAKEFSDGMMAAETSADHRQKALDVIADKMLLDALRTTPLAAIASEERPEPVIFDEAAPIALAIDPLDGSSNIETNIPAGTIFSLLPVTETLDIALLQPGYRQIAAGFVIYGPKTCLVLTLGDGTGIYILDRDQGTFIRSRSDIRIPKESNEYAIDAANYRHWDKPIQAYIDGNVAGADGPQGKNFEMRWIASLVAEAYRILLRGGIFLYPGDRREGYEKGRHSLVFQANPLSMIIEQAGGLATDGEDRILDIEPKDLQQQVPFIFGSENKVERVRACYDGTLPLGERSPLFGRRGLFRH